MKKDKYVYIVYRNPWHFCFSTEQEAQKAVDIFNSKISAYSEMATFTPMKVRDKVEDVIFPTWITNE